MKLAALLAAGFVVVSAPVSAQYIPRPMVPIGPSSAYDAVEIVEAMGLTPIGPPTRIGAFYLQSARDDLGRMLQVTVDARRSQVVSVVAGVPRGLYGPYAGYTPQHRAHRAPAPYPLEEFDIAPPGSVMGSRMMPGGTAPEAMPPATRPKPAAKSAAATAKEPPVPRKRPASAPQQTAGSVEPVQDVPQAVPTPVEKPSPMPPAAPEKPANAMPPVAPLE